MVMRIRKSAFEIGKNKDKFYMLYTKIFLKAQIIFRNAPTKYAENPSLVSPPYARLSSFAVNAAALEFPASPSKYRRCAKSGKLQSLEEGCCAGPASTLF